jgi:hypothetical protein
MISSAAIQAPLLQSPRVQSDPARACLVALVWAAAAAACALPLLQATGGLHVPQYGLPLLGGLRPSAGGDLFAARSMLLFLAPAVLSLFVPLAVAARQRLKRRRALPWLMLAAAGPAVVAVLLVPAYLATICLCGTIN